MTTELEAIAFDINALLIEGESVLWEHFTKVDPPFHIKNLLIYLPWKGLLSIILSLSFFTVSRLSFPAPPTPLPADIYHFIGLIGGMVFIFLYPLYDLSDFIANYTTRSKKLKFQEVRYYLTNERLLACNEKTKEYRSYFYKNWTTLKAISKNNQLEFSTGFKPQALSNVEDPEALQKLILEQLAKKQ
jgi:hypothetical protein